MPRDVRSTWWFSLTLASVLLAHSAPAPAQSTDARQEFERGLIALHEFEYEEANEAFRRAQQLDPAFCMAYWGEAITYHQSLWRRENIDAARQALQRLGTTPAARAAKCRTPPDADMLAAVEILFGRGDPANRRRDYAEAMGRAHERRRDDPDVASLYALSLLGTMSRGLIGTADDHEGHSQGLAGSRIQMQVAAILENVLNTHPTHRGALHYLLHTYDDPDHASLGLSTARAYAQIATASHARHMPSHIFLQLGLWSEAAASDRAAYDASVEWVRRKNSSAALRNFHALSWLEYELLQLGRYREAWQTIAELEPVVKATGQVNLLSDLSSMRARFAVETRRWDLLASERNFGNVNELFAIGMSAARAGRADLAVRASRALAERARAEQEGDLRPAIAIMQQEVAALIELAAGRREAAVDMLKAAASAERRLPAPLGLPEPVKPAPELLGEILLETGRPQEAVEGFTETLTRHARRSLSMVGLARAAAAIGDMGIARRRYRELLGNLDHADEDMPEVREARAALDSTSESRVPITTRTVSIALVAAAVLAGFLVVRRRKGRSSGPNRADRRRKKKGRS